MASLHILQQFLHLHHKPPFAFKPSTATRIATQPFSSSSSSASPSSSSSLLLTFARRRGNHNSPVSSQKPRRKKQSSTKKRTQGDEDDEDEDPFEALFRQLEEDLKNDGLSIDDDDEDISEEDLAKLELELEEVLKDDELFGALGLVGDSKTEDDAAEEDENIQNGDVNYVANHDDELETVEDDNDELEPEEDDDDGEEMPVKLKNWQRKRLAYALKNGRRKTSIKNLAADLCLDRAVVLEILRDPPPDLLMLSASLPDKPASPILEPVNEPKETVPLEMISETPKPTSEAAVVKKLPIHVMQTNWSAKKRIKKAQLETLELAYRRSKRPTNAMVSNIVHLTNLPRKKVLKWFEDKRAAEGVPERRVPYQRDPSPSL